MNEQTATDADREADIRLLCDIVGMPPTIRTRLLAGERAPTVEGVLRMIARHRADATAPLVEALATIRERADYAAGQFHDCTQWRSEPGPDGPDISLWDWVFSPTALAPYKITEMLAVIRVMTTPYQLLAVPSWKAHDLAPGAPGKWSLTVTRNYRLTFLVDMKAQTVSVLDYEDYH